LFNDSGLPRPHTYLYVPKGPSTAVHANANAMHSSDLLQHCMQYQVIDEAAIKLLNSSLKSKHAI